MKPVGPEPAKSGLIRFQRPTSQPVATSPRLRWSTPATSTSSPAHPSSRASSQPIDPVTEELILPPYIRGNSENPADTVMLHEFAREGSKRRYVDLGTISQIKPVVIPPIPHHKPTGIQHYRPPFWGWAGVSGGIRFGFITLYSGGGADSFDFNDYVTDPSLGDCTPSPFYYYPNLPPYIDDQRVQDDNSSDVQETPPTTTTTSPPSSWQPDLPHALTDLETAWQALDRSAADRLLPTSGQVEVHVEGGDSYKLDAKDFSDLFLDGLRNCDTVSYKIEGTKDIAPGRVQVDAEHTFKDPWGATRVVAHKYTLVLEERGYVIREFRSSTYQGSTESIGS